MFLLTQTNGGNIAVAFKMHIGKKEWKNSPRYQCFRVVTDMHYSLCMSLSHILLPNCNRLEAVVSIYDMHFDKLTPYNFGKQIHKMRMLPRAFGCIYFRDIKMGYLQNVILVLVNHAPNTEHRAQRTIG